MYLQFNFNLPNIRQLIILIIIEHLNRVSCSWKDKCERLITWPVIRLPPLGSFSTSLSFSRACRAFLATEPELRDQWQGEDPLFLRTKQKMSLYLLLKYLLFLPVTKRHYEGSIILAHDRGNMNPRFHGLLWNNVLAMSHAERHTMLMDVIFRWLKQLETTYNKRQYSG